MCPLTSGLAICECARRWALGKGPGQQGDQEQDKEKAKDIPRIDPTSL